MKILAVVVNYHSKKWLPDLLAQLRQEQVLNGVIIGNNSAEEKLDHFAKEDDFITVINFDKNLGFAKAVNQCIQSMTADWYLVINPDCLPENGFVKSLLDAAIQLDACLAGPRFYLDKEKSFRLPPATGELLQLSDALIALPEVSATSLEISNRQIENHSSFWKQTAPFSQEVLSGACLLVKNDPLIFEGGKLFDEQFFTYYEDTDLCLRAKQAGAKVICVPDSEVVHYWNQSIEADKTKFMQDSSRLFKVKHPGHGIAFQPYRQSDSTSLHILDLGEIENNYVFSTASAENETWYWFDVGLNPLFVPFLESKITTPGFSFSDEVWRNLQPGLYYSRFRNANNQSSKIWKWLKTATSPSGLYSLHVYSASDAKNVISLWENVFGQKMTKTWWHWKYHESPNAPAGIVAYNQKEEALAFYGGLPMDAIHGTEKVRITQIVDNMAHPQYRKFIKGRKSLFVESAEAFYDKYEHEGTTIFHYGFPGVKNFKLHRLLLNLEPLPNPLIFLELNPKRKKSNIWYSFFRITQHTKSPADADKFWAKVEGSFPLAVIRDSRFLRWRFDAHPNNTYRWFCLRDLRNSLLAWAVVRVIEQTAVIVDICSVNNTKHIQSLLFFVQGVLEEEKITPIKIWITKTHFITEALLMSGFVEKPEPLGIRGIYRNNKHLGNADLNNFYLTMADADLL